MPPAVTTLHTCPHSAQAVGTLRLEVAAELGLPQDVIVAPGGGDNAMAALGSGAVREGTWVLSLGTSGGQLCCALHAMVCDACYGVGLCCPWEARVQACQQQGVAMQGGRACLPVRASWSKFHTAPVHDLPPPAPFSHAHPPGTLFGPSSKPVLDPSGTICPFADAAGGWLPLLCTLNCTGVTEEVSAWASCLVRVCAKLVLCNGVFGFGVNLPLSAMCCGMAMRLPMCNAGGQHMLRS